MKKTLLVRVIAAVAAASIAQAEVNVNVSVGVPAPRVIVPAPPPPPSPRVVVSGPPTVVFEAEPFFLAPSRLGFYVGVDTPYDIIFSSDYYYLYYGNGWYRSRHHNCPWVDVPYRQLPPGLRRHRIEEIRSYRDREYRVYRDDRDHYRGRSYRPGHERREEWKDDRKREKEEWKEERRQDKEDRKEEKRERKHGKQNRDRDSLKPTGQAQQLHTNFITTVPANFQTTTPSWPAHSRHAP